MADRVRGFRWIQLNVPALVLLISALATGVTGTAVSIINALRSDKNAVRLAAVTSTVDQVKVGVEEVHGLVNASTEALTRENKALFREIIALRETIAVLRAAMDKKERGD